MKNTMKKIICLGLTLLMAVPMLALAASANTSAYVEYADAQDGDMLYKFDFNGTAGVFEPADQRGDAWNFSKFESSADGNSATFKYTTDNTVGESQSRARFAGTLEKYSFAGTSYTLEFTLDSAAPVGITLDGGAGFVIQTTYCRTWVGRYGSWGKIGSEKPYEGTFEQAQTFAIEISFPTTTATNWNNKEAYNPTVYKLYVKNAAGTYDFVREISAADAIQFDFEASYERLDFAAIRYNDKFKADADGNDIVSTISDVKLYKGINFIEKTVVENNDENDDGNDDVIDDGNGNGSGNTNTPADTTTKETYAPPKPVTEAPTETEDGATEKGGCGAALTGAGIALATTCLAAFAVIRRKSRED